MNPSPKIPALLVVLVETMIETTESLWDQFGRRLHLFIRKRISDEEDALDILQEAFLRFHSRPPAKTGNLAAWVYTVVRNLIHDYYRQRKGQPEFCAREPLEPERFEVRESEQEVAGWLREMVAELPEKYGHAVALADLEGRSMRQIAERFELSLSGAKSRVQRGRAMLQRQLSDCCAFYFDHRGRVESWLPRQKKGPTGGPEPCGCR